MRARVVKILSLRPYSHGYTGFMEEKESYVFFQFARHGKLTRLMEFDKSEYTDYGHFLGGISRFFPLSHFLKEPIAFESMSISELDRIFDRISDPHGGGDKLKGAGS